MVLFVDVVVTIDRGVEVDNSKIVCGICNSYCDGETLISQLRESGEKVIITDSQIRVIQATSITCYKLTFYQKNDVWYLGGINGTCLECQVDLKECHHVPRHLASHHGLNGTVFTHMTTKGRIYCDICKSFVQKSMLQGHLNTHQRMITISSRGSGSAC
jgi:hypothetical protein